MAHKNSGNNLAEEWWDVLMISPDASVRDIHQAYETLRMSYLPLQRDRSIPISAEATEQLQNLDRAFRSGLDSKNPSATLGKKVASKTNTKAPTKKSKKTAPPEPTSGEDPFHSVVQEWAKTPSQSPTPTPTTEDTQSTKPNKKKSANLSLS